MNDPVDKPTLKQNDSEDENGDTKSKSPAVGEGETKDTNDKDPESAEKETDEKETDEKTRWQSVLYRFLNVHSKYRGVVLIVLTLLWLGAVAGAIYLCWFLLIPAVWSWGFDSEPTWYSRILAVLGAFYLGIAPILPFTYGWDAVKLIMSGYVDEREAALKAKLQDLSQHQKSAEKRLEDEDPTGLIPLITYSRIQLESYYTIGLSQTQRSFRYSILAMWIGFVVIVGGVAVTSNPWFKPEGGDTLRDLRVITIAGGVVIEIISALFLWIYRSSINQLNYFYARQMHIHNVVLCDRIATSMTEPDKTKHLIVEKVLSSVWDVKPLSAPGKGISQLIESTK